MPKKKIEDKFYVVVSKDGSFLHGAFPFTEEGLIKAEKYASEVTKATKDKTEVVLSWHEYIRVREKQTRKDLQSDKKYDKKI